MRGLVCGASTDVAGLWLNALLWRALNVVVVFLILLFLMPQATQWRIARRAGVPAMVTLRPDRAANNREAARMPRIPSQINNLQEFRDATRSFKSPHESGHEILSS